MTIAGDLTVSGTTTYVDSTNTEITDSIIVLNSGEAGAGVTNPIQSGLEIERGTELNAYMVWSEADGKFGVGVADGLTTPTIDMGTFEAFATEAYVDATHAKVSFTTGDWTIGSPNTLVILQSEHGVVADDTYHVTVYEGTEIVSIETSVAANGDVTLTTSGSVFAGRVRISL